MSDFYETGTQHRPSKSSVPEKLPARTDRKRRPTPHPSRASCRALDWFVFFLADVQTGFGAFVSVYLTAQKWTQTDIGFVLTAGSLVGLIGQIPGGALVDAARSTRWVAACAIVAIGFSAFALAASPIFGVVLASRLAQAAASCVLGPAIAAISLGLACGYYFSDRAAFILVASMAAPALFALIHIRTHEIDPSSAHGGEARPSEKGLIAGLRGLLAIRALLVFALAIVLFQIANAAMLPLAASMMTLRSSQSATLLVAVSIVGPQFIVAALSPWVGRKAQQWGRRPLLLMCFAALILRGALFSYLVDPSLLMVVQLLDGVSAATLGVLVPLVVADLSRDTGHFNLAQGAVGCAVGIGASISTTLAGYVTDRFDSATAFLLMSAIGLVGFAVVAFVMTETRQGEEDEE
jgi:MFS family permease